MFDWFKKKFPPILTPPITVTQGTLIEGRLFPKNVTGFTRFDYNEAFKNVPWNESKSFWQDDLIVWNAGQIDTINGQENRITKSIISKINKRWTKLGYLPCFWRKTKINIPDDAPIGKDPNTDVWPIPKKKIILREYTYNLIYSGIVAIHEFCRPMPKEDSNFHHDILCNPIQESNLARYYPDSDFIVPFINRGGVWTIW